MIFTELANKFHFLHILYSLILVFGLNQIGTFIFKIKSLRSIIGLISEIKYQKIFISVNFILLFFYPIILFSNNINFLPVLSLGIFFFGIFNIFRKIIKKNIFRKIDFKRKKWDEIIVIVTLILFFLLSLSPNTHGDSLGYHFVVAKKLLLTGKYIADITHFHSLLSGSGEILIAIGLFFGSEQFGNLIQFSGMISIFGIFKKLKKNNNYFYLLLFLTSPVILFLSSTAKPQLFHLCSVAVIFSLYFFEHTKNLTFSEKKWKIIISIFVLIVSVSAKFNFILSSFLLTLIILHNSIREKTFLNFLFISTIAFLVFYLPIITWKYNNFGGTIFQYLYSPVPLNIIGLEEFKQYLVRYGRGNNLIEILFTTKLNQFTNSVGIAFLYLLIVNFREKKAFIAFVFISIYIFFLYYYGQFVGRSFLEPLLWILLICARYGVFYKIKIFGFLCRAQAFVVIGGIIIGIYSLFPGSLTKSLKDKTLSENANGYALFKWANSKLNKEDVVFSIHRSISLGKSEFIAMDFVPFVDFKDDRSDIFVKAIFKKNPKYLLTYGYSNEKPRLNEFINCVGEMIHYKKNVGKFEARNPFNRGRKYDGYIFKITKTDIPSCIKK
tara:strand:- start:883 stop:2709 length:1827 start_codon:yes stop_codon:yes gene_type:complete